MSTSNIANSQKEDTYSQQQRQPSYSQSPSSSQALQQQQRSNGSNKYIEEYSFNKRKCDSQNNAFDENINTDRLGKQFVSRCSSQLIRRYSQIYSKLQALGTLDVIHLFLQQLHQNEQYRQKLQQAQLSIKRLQLQVKEVKQLLQSKRKAIRKLCQTQTNNLNLIQCLQQQQRKRDFNWDSYFKKKYEQLLVCMNQYISNTNEAQQQFTHTYKILKLENQTLCQINQQSLREQLQGKRLLKLTEINLAKCLQSLTKLEQRQRELMMQLEEAKACNGQLQRQIQQLRQKVKAYQYQFEVEVKQNKQTSSDLDFIRQKLNSNSHSGSKIDIQSLIRQKQQLIRLLTTAVANNDCTIKQKQQLQADYGQLIHQLQSKNQLLQTMHHQLLLLNQQGASSKKQSISNNSRGEFSRIDANSSFIDSSSFTQRLLITNHSNYQYKDLF